MSSVEALVTSILEEGGFDATQSMALNWLDQRHRLMCSRTRCFRKKLSAPTVAGQRGYPVPAEVQEIREVLVESSAATGSETVPYGAGHHSDLAQGALGYIWLGGLYSKVGGGIFVRDESATGEDLLALYPTPTESGLIIMTHAVCRPAALVVDGQTVTPPEFDDALVAGAIGTGLERIEGRPDLAASSEAKFEGACVELLRQVNDRFRPTGPVQIRVRGINA